MSNTEFYNKNVIVTGGGRGIGKAVCEKFINEGAKVFCLDIRAEIIIEGVKYIDIDVTSFESIEAWLGMSGIRSIHTLVNCAGITRRANVLQTTIDEWNSVLNVNLTATFLTCKLFIPKMRKGSTIINIASGWGLVGGKKAVSYCASKGGVVLLTKAMALDHGENGIRVNCVCPGDTETKLLEDEALQLGLAPTTLIEQGVNRPLQRVGKASEIADAVCFLASSKSSFITGEALVVDGGSLAGSQ